MEKKNFFKSTVETDLTVDKKTKLRMLTTVTKRKSAYDIMNCNNSTPDPPLILLVTNLRANSQQNYDTLHDIKTKKITASVNFIQLLKV